MSSPNTVEEVQLPQTLEQWLNYIGELHTTAIDLGLQRIKPLAEKLALTHFDCPVIMVGGTNGKGSTVHILEQIYLANKYRVATYTSPHLLRFNERLRLNGLDINDEALIQAFETIEYHRDDQDMSFFEFTTLAILWLCQQFDPDVVLLEVGLGGRLDAVNVVEPDVSIVTSVGMDHLQWLGYSREQIGREKAGIFRTDKPAICGDLDPPKSINNIASRVDAKLLQIGKDFNYIVTPPSWHWQGKKQTLKLLPIPRLNINNAACSLMAIECLARKLSVSKSSIYKGLKKAELPGRFECITSPRSIIFDVAHNSDSADYLAKQLRNRANKGRLIAVFGMLKDKSVFDSIIHLTDLVDTWLVSDLDTPRSCDSQQIYKILKDLKHAHVHRLDNVAEALQQAIAQTDKDDTIIVCGSFHTVAEAKQCLSQYS